jgi:peptidoglycan LD-endopeptidase LytH
MKYGSKSSYYILLCILLGAISASWIFTIKTFTENKAEIIIQISEILEDIALPFRIAKLGSLPRDEKLPMPVQSVLVKDVDDSWGGIREGGRLHEGVDIFAKRGTLVFSATRGYVLRVGVGERGGNYIFIIGPGEIRYYYAHLDSVVEGLDRGDEVTIDTVIGFVGNTGNAAETSPHLHLGVYGKSGPENPHPLIVNRSPPIPQ